MATKSVLSGMVKVHRRLHDQALKMSGKLLAWAGVTLYRYRVTETDHREETKVLIGTIPDITIYVDFPGDISNLSSNTPAVMTISALMI